MRRRRAQATRTDLGPSTRAGRAGMLAFLLPMAVFWVFPASASAQAKTARPDSTIADGGWTAQLGLFCDAGRVQEMLAQFGDREAFHILPSLYRDEACFRVCWGRYASADKARAARDLPAQLRGVAPTPLPKSVAEVLE